MSILTNPAPNDTTPPFRSEGGISNSASGFALVRLFERRKKRLLFIAENDVAMTQHYRQAKFFGGKLSDAKLSGAKFSDAKFSGGEHDPVLNIACFPAWDSLPYEWISPRADIRAKRLALLCEWQKGQTPDIVLTTASAVLQKLPPRDSFAGAMFELKIDKTERALLLAFLEAKGYERAGTVHETGEYAVRGSVIDIFPCGQAKPVRADFMGEALETLRYFDPISQISEKNAQTSQKDSGPVKQIKLYPAGEIFLSRENCDRFRQNYRLHVSRPVDHDSFYQAISEGRKQPGFEHWLPLFHEETETILDYLPDYDIVYAPQAPEAFTTHHELVADNHEARIEALEAEKDAYPPLAPAQLYLDAKEWRARTSSSEHIIFQPEISSDGEEKEKSLFREGADFSDLMRRGEFYALFAERLAREKRRFLFFVCSQGARERLKAIFAEKGFDELLVDMDDVRTTIPAGKAGIAVLDAGRGFTHDDLVVITERDLFGERLGFRKKRRKSFDAELFGQGRFDPGDFVVHEEHGIGRYEGLEAVALDGVKHDCLALRYADEVKLYVPVENMDRIHLHGGADNPVTPDRLGSDRWQKRKASMRRKLRDMADELIAIAARRKLKKAPVLLPPGEGVWENFCARFPFVETETQLEAIEDVMKDLASGRVMDRLVCGNAGVGKTEVALRAAFITASTGRQVAMVVPTTLLARQHYESFKKRLDGFAPPVFLLTRHSKPIEARAIKARLEKGEGCIVIGTHALLSTSVKFGHPGLAIIDEEQQFGVAQKERLKKAFPEMHFLTLTATPIPRSLQLALSGVRDLSLIAHPPLDRLATRLFITPFDRVLIREALRREYRRGGQTFCVCPRRADLPEAERMLRSLMPSLKIVLAHGKMKAGELEAMMADFVEGRADILLSTPIVESGLDIPKANTMVVFRAHMFGLAQLYQLRGRTGRGKVRGFCYFTLPKQLELTESGRGRLDFMRELDATGAGFHLACHDMDMRGAGNILGQEQTGHIPETGVELYQKLLARAVAEAQNLSSVEQDFSPTVNLGVPILIPDSYIPDLTPRMEIYGRLARLDSEEDIDAMVMEMVDRFGPLPEETRNLTRILKIRTACKKAGIEKLEAGMQGITIQFFRQRFVHPAGLAELMNSYPDNFRLRPDHSLVYRCKTQADDKRFEESAFIAQKLREVSDNKPS